MKTKNLKKKNKLITVYCLVYVIKYLRCILVQAQMEQIAIQNIMQNNTLNSQKLFKLNLKHNKMVKSLYDQKMKIEYCA